MRYGILVVMAAVAAGCGNSQVTSDEEAELAYIGLDEAVGRAMRLGLKGFNEASNANIDDQQEAGTVGGTMTVGGQVDQGVSDNKTLSLVVSLDDYQDVVDLDEDDKHELEVAYETDEPATLDMKLSGIPDGTFTGTFAGTFFMLGDLEGEVTLSLALDGDLEPDIEGGVLRVAGTTSVEGTVTNDDGGEYEVDLTL